MTGGGIKINNDSYNVFCYADDLILTSLSVIGLQELIDKAREYITNHGLNFNPSKTICTIYGSSPFIINPTWNLDGKPLREEKTVTFLGTLLSENTNDHVMPVFSLGGVHSTASKVLVYVLMVLPLMLQLI